MALLNLEGNNVALATGIALPQVQEQSVLFVTRLKEVAKLGDEITIAHVLLLKQAGWKPNTKANTAGFEDWLNSLYQGNKTLFSRAKAWVKQVCGLDVEVRDLKGDAVGTYVVMTTTNEWTETKSLDEHLALAVSEGILMTAKPKKAPKASAGKGGSKNGAVETVNPNVIKAEELGIIDALANIEEGTAELLAQLMAHIKTNPDKQAIRVNLEKTVNSLNKGFTLGAAILKQVG